MQRQRGRLVHQQVGRPFLGDEAKQARAPDRRHADCRARRLARGPDVDRDAITYQRDATSSAQRHGDGLGRRQPRILGTKAVADTAGDAHERFAQQADLVARRSIAVPEGEEAKARRKRQPRRHGRPEPIAEPAHDAHLDRDLDVVERRNRARGHDLVGAVTVEVDDQQVGGAAARFRDRAEEQLTSLQRHVVDEEAAAGVDPGLLEARLSHERHAFPVSDAANDERAPARRHRCTSAVPPDGISGTACTLSSRAQPESASVQASARIAPREARTRRMQISGAVAIQVGGNRLVRRRLGQEEGARLVGHGRDRLRGGWRGRRTGGDEEREYGGEHRGGHGSAGLWHHRRHAPAARAVVAAARCPRANPHRRLPPLARRRARAALRRLRGPASLVGHRRRRVLAVDLGPLRRALRDRTRAGDGRPTHAGRALVPGRQAQLGGALPAPRAACRRRDRDRRAVADARAGVADGGRAA